MVAIMSGERSLEPATNPADFSLHTGDVQADRKFPLFVTRFGLSDRTAIGAQTRQLLNCFSRYMHLYWHEAPFDPAYPHSHRLETRLFGQLDILKHDNVTSRLLRKLNASHWHGDEPSAAVTTFLGRLKQEISMAYLAPIEAGDARRMKAIAEELQRPFVLHFWDFLDSNAAESATTWLIDNATHIFCLNRQIQEDLRGARRRSSILTFTRGRSNAIAKFTSSPEIRIAVTGSIEPYVDGMKCLVGAVQLLRAAGKNYTIVYIGLAKSLRRCGLDNHDFITATGFIESAEARDKLLAECAVGFMPGPSAAPETDARAKYSIPSRILDYLAVGLPIVGTVHPRSATFAFCRDSRLDVGLLQDDPQRVARSFTSLEDEAMWRSTSRRNLAAFSALVEAHGIEDLKRMLAPETHPSGNLWSRLLRRH